MANEVRINEEKMDEIQDLYRSKVFTNHLNLRMVDGLGGTQVATGNWCIAKVQDLSELIRELTIMKESIEEVTGVRF